MPAMFQMSLDTTILNLTNIFGFLDYILIISSHGLEDHHMKVESCLKRLDDKIDSRLVYQK